MILRLLCRVAFESNISTLNTSFAPEISRLLQAALILLRISNVWVVLDLVVIWWFTASSQVMFHFTTVLDDSFLWDTL